MISADYLRHQADSCVRMARSCFDLTTAERLRLMATELREKANEIDDMQRGGGSRERTMNNQMSSNGG